MSWNFKLLKMNWKFALIIVLGLVLATVAFIKLPISQAQSNSVSDEQDNQAPVVNGKITQYPNGVSKIEPNSFGITAPVRDLPTSDPDALAKRGSFVDPEKRRDQKRKELLREKGVYVEDNEEQEEINEQNAEKVKRLIPGAGAGYGDFLDPLLRKDQNVNAPQVQPTPSLTFQGASQIDNAAVGIGGVLPPDVNGDVGPNHYVSSVNLVYKIYNKNGTVAAGPFPTSALFAGLPAGDPCRTFNDGDPVVVYDSLADRWHISQFAVPGNPNNFQCVALCKHVEQLVQHHKFRLTDF